MIYVFGNSHAHFFTDSTPSKIGEGEKENEQFRTFSLGPVIAYNFIDHHLPMMINYINTLPITPIDSILIAVGEVDCRWHLPNQANIQKKEINEIIHECVDRLFIAHTHLRESGYDVIGWGGHPSTTEGHSDDPSRPVFGDCLYRNQITLEWNDYLSKKCQGGGFKFSSVVRDLINEDGLTKMEYYKDYCHLDSLKFLPTVIEKFKKEKIL
jgi:hypothetical protein